MGLLLGWGASLRPVGCLGVLRCGEVPVRGAEWERAGDQERGRALPPPGCVTSSRLLPFLGLSVSLCKMDMALSLEVLRGCDPTSLPPGPPTGRWPLPLSRRRREMSSNKEQRSAVFVVLFALITILILYSSNSANEVFHYGSLRGRTRRPVNLKKWSITDAYVPILGNKTLPSRCHQCVIVTSSSHLLGTKLGPEIERAECTIRMNDAPTTGYSADVGNKTTFRVVAHSSVFRVLRRPQEFVNRTPETVFIFWGPPNKMQKPQGSLVRVIQRAGLVFPNMEAYAVSPGRMRQFDDLFRGETGKDREKSHSWLSTGWFTMVIAVELCDHVHVYGMVPPDYCR
ncbi:alpha-N-acetylgalactosaminide alpha-2,6-sialyltransferase 6 isoform X4 [Vulpes vulpes]|uniref:Alpha-N-acetylgalactosaminide alpha-2,6-sialyltransferase 6 isoform X4 n=2 Tax=Vulpes TaxID=9625 RepID=A0ABM4Z5S8_VULVU